MFVEVPGTPDDLVIGDPIGVVDPMNESVEHDALTTLAIVLPA
jgi:hypothetical protein